MGTNETIPTETPQTTEVEVPIKKEGTVQFMTQGALNNPAPAKLKRIFGAIKNVVVGLMTMVAATDLFTGGQAKVISFCLGVAVLILSGIGVSVGVVPEEEIKP